MEEIIITTTDFVPGFEIERIIGVVFGNTVRAKHIGKDISALFKNIVGGEIQEYTEMLSEARKEALNRMIKNAKELGADAVLNVRFATSQTMAGAAELLAYGTAVKLKKKY
ncbi:MAG: YbjQ family protein [Archaeoglobaceae archaeon]